MHRWGGSFTKHIELYELDLLSEPIDWFRSFMSLYHEDNLKLFEFIDGISVGETSLSVANCSKYTYTKGVFAGDGQEGGDYDYDWLWTPMSTVDIF